MRTQVTLRSTTCPRPSFSGRRSQVTSICSECLEWGYTKTRQYVVMSAYLKLVLHLISELHVWRHVRADEEVERHVSQSLQEVYIAVQQTLVALTQSTGTPLPTAVKGCVFGTGGGGGGDAGATEWASG